MKNKLDEIGNVRNALAHFRPIRKGDIDLVKQNSIHTLTEIEKMISDFSFCNDVVPTNTEAKWYKEIIILESKECKIQFHQSKKEEWIRLSLTFNATIFRSSKINSGLYIRTANLKTDEILFNFPELSKHVVSVTEVIPYIYTQEPDSALVKKQIRFTFSRNSLEKNHETIKAEIQNLLYKISNEIILISEDNLARGKLIEVVTGVFRKTDASDYFEFIGKSFKTEYEEESPVEFWGEFSTSSRNFITETEKYPWMPVDISEDKDDFLPF